MHDGVVVCDEPRGLPQAAMKSFGGFRSVRYAYVTSIPESALTQPWSLAGGPWSTVVFQKPSSHGHRSTHATVQVHAVSGGDPLASQISGVRSGPNIIPSSSHLKIFFLAGPEERGTRNVLNEHWKPEGVALENTICTAKPAN